MPFCTHTQMLPPPSDSTPEMLCVTSECEGYLLHSYTLPAHEVEEGDDQQRQYHAKWQVAPRIYNLQAAWQLLQDMFWGYYVYTMCFQTLWLITSKKSELSQEVDLWHTKSTTAQDHFAFTTPQNFPNVHNGRNYVASNLCHCCLQTKILQAHARASHPEHFFLFKLLQQEALVERLKCVALQLRKLVTVVKAHLLSSGGNGIESNVAEEDESRSIPHTTHTKGRPAAFYEIRALGLREPRNDDEDDHAQMYDSDNCTQQNDVRWSAGSHVTIYAATQQNLELDDYIKYVMLSISYINIVGCHLQHPTMNTYSHASRPASSPLAFSFATDESTYCCSQSWSPSCPTSEGLSKAWSAQMPRSRASAPPSARRGNFHCVKHQ